jgi:hypothetical protein
MTTQERKDAKCLAVAYQAFIEAHAHGDMKRRAIWAKALRLAQRMTGVEVYPDATLEVFART